MKNLVYSLLTAVLVMVGSCCGSWAQSTSAVVVAACGTPPATYSAGANRALTQDTTGALCSGGGGTSSNATIVAPLGSKVSAQSVSVVVASDQAAVEARSTVAANFLATATLAPGSAIIGNVRIDQTTPGTTNGVQTLTGSTTAVTQATASNLNATVVVTPATTVSSAALAANQIIVASAGKLVSFEVAADSTLSGAAWWIMIYNATSAPADGAVTPAKCYALPSGTTGFNGAFNAPVTFGTGIVIGVSSSGCFAKTASTHAFISADYQ